MVKPRSVLASARELPSRAPLLARACSPFAAPVWLWLAVVACIPPAYGQTTFKLTSKDLKPGQPVAAVHVYDKDGCTGKNRSPQLQWSGEPPGTKSFAVTMFDEDAPGPRGWWHWAVTGIPVHVHQLPEDASASGFLSSRHAVQASNDFGTLGYGGPCPPPGQPHRYIVTVYALSTDDLRLSNGGYALMFDHEIGTAILGKASITVTYSR
jgi:Raf kinase inhibitor-like YbhB/YbcL family protein